MPPTDIEPSLIENLNRPVMSENVESVVKVSCKWGPLTVQHPKCVTLQDHDLLTPMSRAFLDPLNTPRDLPSITGSLVNVEHTLNS